MDLIKLSIVIVVLFSTSQIFAQQQMDKMWGDQQVKTNMIFTFLLPSMPFNERFPPSLRLRLWLSIISTLGA